MKISITLLALSLLGFTLSSQADIKTERETVNTACADDAKTANCPDAKMGAGLMKCFHEYKTANKEFKHTEACLSAIKTFKSNHKPQSNK